MDLKTVKAPNAEKHQFIKDTSAHLLGAAFVHRNATDGAAENDCRESIRWAELLWEELQKAGFAR